MKHALVTGGSGFIGRHLIKTLADRGVRVRATARSSESEKVVRALGAEPVTWSLEADCVPHGIFEGIDTVFHLAAPRRVFLPVTGGTRRLGDPALVSGTDRLARAFAAAGTGRFVVSSSATVYGKPWGEVCEDTIPAPSALYGETRLQAEQAAAKAFAATPNRLVIARLTETFGPGSPGQLGLLRRIAVGEFRMIGTGSAVHHVSTVADVVAGLLLCGTTAGAGGQVLHVASLPRRFRTFIEAAAAELDQPLRDSPWAQAPAVTALRIFRAVPALRRRFPSVNAALDYQVRSRSFSVARSVALLGPYQTDDFEAAVAASARAAIATERAAP